MERREFMSTAAIGSAAATMTMSQRAEALEQQMSAALDKAVADNGLNGKGVGLPWMCQVAEAAERIRNNGPDEMPGAGQMLMGDDPRLPKMPAAPTLMDFQAAVCAGFSPVAKRQPGAKKRPFGKDRDGVPASRCGHCQFAAHRPRLLGGTINPALCRRGNQLVDPRASITALFCRPLGGLRISEVLCS